MDDIKFPRVRLVDVRGVLTEGDSVVDIDTGVTILSFAI